MIIMVSKEEFKDYVKNIISEDKNEINTKCLSYSYKLISIVMLVTSIIISLSSTIAIILQYRKIYGFTLVLGVVMIVISIVMINVRKKTFKYYRDNYREKIIGYLLNDYIYYFDNHGWVDSYEFDYSQFAKNCTTCYAGDMLDINIPNDDNSKSKIDLRLVDIRGCEIWKDNEGNIQSNCVYEGVFGYVEFSRKFKCILTINSKYKKRGVKFEKVLLEDIDFNEKFDVESNNQVEARYILTPNMMEKLLKLQEKINDIKIVLVNRNLYIGFPNFNMFELNYKNSNDEMVMFENLYDEIEIILGIVEEIKANNKVFKV